MLLVSGINCEVRAGEILAIMATADGEATGLLNVFAGIDKVSLHFSIFKINHKSLLYV